MSINTSPLRRRVGTRRDESAISDLARHGFEEEGYPVVDYESDRQTAMSTTIR
uniref:Ulp1 protease-like n=1 Tax=Oryza glaberrima TaxID=4538 RepID=I1R6A8_ORYGL